MRCIAVRTGFVECNHGKQAAQSRLIKGADPLVAKYNKSHASCLTVQILHAQQTLC